MLYGSKFFSLTDSNDIHIYNNALYIRDDGLIMEEKV